VAAGAHCSIDCSDSTARKDRCKPTAGCLRADGSTRLLEEEAVRRRFEEEPLFMRTPNPSVRCHPELKKDKTRWPTPAPQEGGGYDAAAAVPPDCDADRKQWCAAEKPGGGRTRKCILANKLRLKDEKCKAWVLSIPSSPDGIDSTRGCPGGTFEKCLFACAGPLSQRAQNLEQPCKATCAQFCPAVLDKA
jgi:hypothetical protein